MLYCAVEKTANAVKLCGTGNKKFGEFAELFV